MVTATFLPALAKWQLVSITYNFGKISHKATRKGGFFMYTIHRPHPAAAAVDLTLSFDLPMWGEEKPNG